MIAVDPGVGLLIFSLASEGPSTHGTDGIRPHDPVRFSGFQGQRIRRGKQAAKLPGEPGTPHDL